MRNAILLFIIFSAFLLSCRNEENREVTVPAENLQTQKETQKAAEQPAVIKDSIEVYQPLPGELISPPLKIEGRARGYWYFEASFTVRLLDDTGREIAVVPAQAQNSWMTEDWVDFSATMEFEDPGTEEGVLVFEKANPSGLEKHDRELRVPVKFGN